MSRGPRSWWMIFRVPLGLCLLSIVGLVAALIGDGIWDLLSWCALGLPVALIGSWLRPGRPDR